MLLFDPATAQMNLLRDEVGCADQTQAIHFSSSGTRTGPDGGSGHAFVPERVVGTSACPRDGDVVVQDPGWHPHASPRALHGLSGHGAGHSAQRVHQGN